jgi:hypothetical protein
VQINTWMEGSYSPVHRHDHHAESFVVLEVSSSLIEGLGTNRALGASADVGPMEASHNTAGARQGVLAFFTFKVDEGQRAPADITCHLLGPHVRLRGIIVEQREWHAMTAAPASLGYPGAHLCLTPVLIPLRAARFLHAHRCGPSELAPHQLSVWAGIRST